MVSPADTASVVHPTPSTTPRRRPGVPQFLKLLLANRKAQIGFVMLGFITLAAIVGPFFTHGINPADIGTTEPSLPPTSAHPFGTTDQGQDLLMQVLYGGRISLIVGATASILATAIATTFGLLAAYRPGMIDNIVNLVTNIFLVIPFLPLLIVIAAFIPQRGGPMLILLIGFTSWAGEAKVLRGQAMGLRGRDFIMASKVAGESTWRIVFGEFVPNMISRIAAGFIFTFIGAIFAEAGLEFLGFGDATKVSWGTILYWAGLDSALAQGEWWFFTFPGLAIALTVVGLIFLNYGVDELSNPRLRKMHGESKRGLVERLTMSLRTRGKTA